MFDETAKVCQRVSKIMSNGDNMSDEDYDYMEWFYMDIAKGIISDYSRSTAIKIAKIILSICETPNDVEFHNRMYNSGHDSEYNSFVKQEAYKLFSNLDEKDDLTKIKAMLLQILFA